MCICIYGMTVSDKCYSHIFLFYVLLSAYIALSPGQKGIYKFTPSNWCSRSATACFTWARNIVVQHKIIFFVDVERMVYFPCVWLCFICVSFKFTLGSCVFTLCWICVVIEHMLNSKWFQISTSWTQKYPEHTLSRICWVKSNVYCWDKLSYLYTEISSNITYNFKFIQRTYSWRLHPIW